MAEVVYSTIQIAPYDSEITIEGDTVSTSFAGGIKYTAPGLEMFKEQVVKTAFSIAIALASKPWQIEKALNDFFQRKGTVTTD